MVHFYSGIQHAVVAYYGARAYISLRIYLYVAPETRTFAHIGECAYVSAFRQLHAFCHEAWLLHPCRTCVHHGVNHLKQAGQSGVGVVHAYQCGIHGMLGYKVAAHKHYRRVCVVDVVRVFRVSQERERTVCGFLYFGECAYGGVFVAIHGAAYGGGYLACSEFHFSSCSN